MNASIDRDIRTDRSYTLRLKGDWGQANLHTTCGWLGHEFINRSGPDTRHAIWNGRGGLDGVRSVACGEVDIAIVTPSVGVTMALEGLGPFAGTPLPFLRALGQVPQYDRLVFGVRKDLGVSSFADILEKKPPLRIATGPDDGENLVGFAAHRIMEASGVDAATLASWGGAYLPKEYPRACTLAVQAGEANAIIHEAIMTNFWPDMLAAVDMTLISYDEPALAYMEKTYRWPRAEVPAGYFAGFDAPTSALEFSDFLVLCSEDLPDEVAYILTHIMCAARESLERKYRHIKPEASPVSYPLEPRKMARTPIPLHPAAARYYGEIGAL